ncbi:IQ domain-containing protein C [Sceloporus undulatus]|uniref:IQ domain-containing protein C n=1 Tax=Sceloporus undulatus TaxID=8520 RepID=UPI001C4C507A|nr:IQ domain-containing protein C [Sceloporus undulatus]
MGQEEGPGLQLQLFLRRVAVLQACIRGFLVRKRFRRLKGEFEDIVKEIEGSLDRLQWENSSLPKPVFLPKSVQKSIKTKEWSSREADRSKSREHEQNLHCEEELLPEKERDCKLPKQMVAVAEEEDMKQNPEYLERKPCGNDCSMPAEDEEEKEASNVSSEWSSTILGMGSPRLSQELRFQKGQEIPQTLPELQQYQKNLAMELLWLQQAIVSRKNYLILKQRLGSSK